MTSPNPGGKFGRAIYRARSALGLTQAAAAKVVGVASNTWARWERGEIVPHRITRVAVLRALKEAPAV